jgi:hypothetical protein
VAPVTMPDDLAGVLDQASRKRPLLRALKNFEGIASTGKAKGNETESQLAIRGRHWAVLCFGYFDSAVCRWCVRGLTTKGK